MCQVNNLVIFSGKPIGCGEFLNRMVEALGITIDRRPKEKPCELKSQTIEKIGCVVPILIKKLKVKWKCDIARPGTVFPVI